MSSQATSNATKSKKKRNKKKAAGDKSAANGDLKTELQTHEEVEDGAESPTKDHAEDESPDEDEHEAASEPLNPSNGFTTNGSAEDKVDEDTSAHDELVAKLDALAQERDALKEEVSSLRKELEDIQEKHGAGSGDVIKELEEAQAGKEHWETQYNQLLERVNTIRSQLGERLKADRAEIAQQQSQIEDLEERNRKVQEQNESLQKDISRVTAEKEQQGAELDSLRNRANLSQQNWIKERDELLSREAYAREEFESAKQAMQDWEVLAMEERSLRQNLSDRVGELEDQLSGQQEIIEKATAERDTQSQAVDGLQRALRDIQEARKRELRELVENSQSQVDALRKQLQTAEETSSAAQAELELTQKELEQALPFEKEVKEKNLHIGKLRHEAVILNDHLTKALRFLKQRKPEDMIDRQLVTNHFLQFITLDRSDPKKFQVLQLISAMLAWTDEQKEKAGLARAGSGAAPASTTSSSLRLPISPFRRQSSQTALANDIASIDSRTNAGSKETLAELWSDFLEREAQEGQRSRRGSDLSAISSPTDKKRPGPGSSAG